MIISYNPEPVLDQQLEDEWIHGLIYLTTKLAQATC